MVLFLTAFSDLVGQDQIGMKTSNMAPAQMIRLNPSAMVDSRPYWDLELFGIGLLVENDYAYAPADEFNIWRLDFPEEIGENFDGDANNAYTEAVVFLPTYTRVAGRYSWGFQSAVRTYVNALDVPGHLSKLLIEDFEFPALQGRPLESSGLAIKAMSWLEIGGQFGMIVYQKRRDMLNAGISLKRLFGTAAGGFQLNRLDYVSQGDSTLVFNNLSGQFGIVDPAFNQGRGWGVDLGVTYKKMLEDVDHYVPHSKKSNCKLIDYKYKVGLSLLDLGAINFDNGTSYREFSSSQSTWENFDDEDPSDLNDLVVLFDSNLAPSSTANEFRAALPTSLNAQFDYNFENDFRIAAVGNFGFSRKTSMGVQRLSYLSVIPRYERLRFEVAANLTYNSLNRVKMGGMIRLGPLMIGAENVIPYFLNVDVRGMDFFFTLRLTKFGSGACDLPVSNWRVKDCKAPKRYRNKGQGGKIGKRNRRKRKQYK